MPSEFEFPGYTNRLNSLSKALANVFLESSAPAPKWWERGVELVAEKASMEAPLTDAPDFRKQEFPVDYSPIEMLIHATVPYGEVTKKTAETFRGKLVLIGDATPFQGADTAIVPGQEEPVPGVFVHACAAYTLALAPLRELRPKLNGSGQERIRTVQHS